MDESNPCPTLVGTDDGKTVQRCRDGNWESVVEESKTVAVCRTSNVRDEV